MSPARLRPVLESLTSGGFPEVEVYAKKGRGRRFAIELGEELIGISEEEGWAVRAGDERCSFFATGTGVPGPGADWPAADGYPLRLPEPLVGGSWTEPADLEVPLFGERDGLELLRGLSRALEAELPGSRLLSARLDDGASRHRLLNSRGVEVSWRSRVAALELEAAGPEGRRASLQVAGRGGRGFDLRALARRLANSLAVAENGERCERDRGPIVLGPEIGCRLLLGLLPLLVGPEAPKRWRALLGGGGRDVGDGMTVVDDGRLAGGILEGPWDGEGLPTGPSTLVSAGRYLQPLLDWREAKGGDRSAVGCCRRASWRDVPATGPSHLYLRPNPRVPLPALLAEVPRGYYFFDPAGEGTFDLAEDRFELPVRGFTLRDGRATTPIARARVSGTLSGLLRGVKGVGRDLRFLPADGMIGSPSLLIQGAEILG